MDYDTLDMLRQNHPAWRLLKADHAALIVSFLHRSYIACNARTLGEAELVLRLEDYLYHLRRERGDNVHARRSRLYRRLGVRQARMAA